jgi:hypothetical protein
MEELSMTRYYLIKNDIKKMSSKKNPHHIVAILNYKYGI